MLRRNRVNETRCVTFAAAARRREAKGLAVDSRTSQVDIASSGVVFNGTKSPRPVLSNGSA